MSLEQNAGKYRSVETVISRWICCIVKIPGNASDEKKRVHKKADETQGVIYTLRGLSPRANYTDRAAAAGRRS